jgi:CBS-domain-containing membrane protein
VLDVSLSHPQYTSFVDVVDIVSHVVSQLNPEERLEADTIPALFHDFIAADIVDASKRNPFCPVEDGAPLEVALRLMVKWGVHRIPIVDAEGNLVTLITQSQVIKHFYDNRYTILSDLNNKTVAELSLGTRDVTTVDPAWKLVDCFKVIRDRVNNNNNNNNNNKEVQLRVFYSSSRC